MFRNVVILALPLMWAGILQSAAPQDNFEATMSRAESLYYEARFKDSVELLLPVDAMLRDQPGRASQSIRVKLQLALGYIGQNQVAQAKSVFQEVCALDAAYALDANQFAPKVLTLFNEAKAEQKKMRCDAWCGEVDQSSKAADVAALLRLAKETADGCMCAATAGAADLLYTQGVEAYKKDDFRHAIENLRAALKFRPQHDLAVQYTELAESKIKVTVEQRLLDWRKHFEAQEFPKATTAYRQLESVNVEGKGDGALEQIRGEYRKVAASKLDSWNRVCSTGGALSLETVRQEARDLFPDEAMGADAVSKFTPCEAKVASLPPIQKVELPAAVTAAPTTKCLEMPSQQAMARIKSQVNPNIPFERLPREPLSLRVKVRIAENGNVSVIEIAGAPADIVEAMRSAVERWKFLPAVVGDQSRCVETELPVRLSRS